MASANIWRIFFMWDSVMPFRKFYGRTSYIYVSFCETNLSHSKILREGMYRYISLQRQIHRPVDILNVRTCRTTPTWLHLYDVHVLYIKSIVSGHPRSDRCHLDPMMESIVSVINGIRRNNIFRHVIRAAVSPPPLICDVSVNIGYRIVFYNLSAPDIH